MKSSSKMPLRLSREEKRIVSLLTKGYTQAEISTYLIKRGIKPNSKKLNYDFFFNNSNDGKN